MNLSLIVFLRIPIYFKTGKRKPDTAEARWNDVIKQTSHWLEDSAFSSQNLFEKYEDTRTWITSVTTTGKCISKVFFSEVKCADQPNENMATKTFSSRLVFREMSRKSGER